MENLKAVTQHSGNVSVYTSSHEGIEEIKRYGTLVATRFNGTWFNRGEHLASEQQSALYDEVVAIARGV